MLFEQTRLSHWWLMLSGNTTTSCLQDLAAARYQSEASRPRQQTPESRAQCCIIALCTRTALILVWKSNKVINYTLFNLQGGNFRGMCEFLRTLGGYKGYKKPLSLPSYCNPRRVHFYLGIQMGLQSIQSPSLQPHRAKER